MAWRSLVCRWRLICHPASYTRWRSQTVSGAPHRGCEPELLKAEDVRTHVCAIVLRNCTKFVLLDAKQEKTKNFFLMILAQFDKNFQNCTCFYGILATFLCAKFSVWKICCAKELAYRRSGVSYGNADPDLNLSRKHKHCQCKIVLIWGKCCSDHTLFCH